MYCQISKGNSGYFSAMRSCPTDPSVYATECLAGGGDIEIDGAAMTGLGTVQR